MMMHRCHMMAKRLVTERLSPADDPISPLDGGYKLLEREFVCAHTSFAGSWSRLADWRQTGGCSIRRSSCCSDCDYDCEWERRERRMRQRAALTTCQPSIRWFLQISTDVDV